MNKAITAIKHTATGREWGLRSAQIFYRTVPWTTQLIKDKDANFLYEPTEILERLAEYVEELYDDIQDDCTVDVVTQKMYIISELEVKSVNQKLSRNKATGSDNIPAEFLQSLGERGLQVITKLMNKIYNILLLQLS